MTADHYTDIYNQIYNWDLHYYIINFMKYTPDK